MVAAVIRACEREKSLSTYMRGRAGWAKVRETAALFLSAVGEKHFGYEGGSHCHQTAGQSVHGEALGCCFVA